MRNARAAHPGKARGLSKHSARQVSKVTKVVRNHRSGTTGTADQPRHPSSFEPAPQASTPAPAGGGTSHDGNSHPASPPATGRSRPASAQPPLSAKRASALARVLLDSNPTPFTALPLAIISVLALGVCGLIGLARHRAA